MSIEFIGIRQGECNENEKGKVVATEIYLYLVDDAETAYDVLKQPEIPGRGTSYSGNSAMKRTTATASKADGSDKKLTYEVTVNYETPDPDPINNPDDPNIAPWNRPVEGWKITPVDNIVAFEQAYDDGDTQFNPTKPVTSSADTPLGATTNKPNLILSFDYNKQTFTDSDVLNYFNTVNSANITVTDLPIKAGKGLLRKYSPQLMREYNQDGTIKYTYYKVSVEIEINNDGWTRKLADMSIFMVDDTDSLYRIYQDSSKESAFGTKQDLINSGSKEANVSPVDTPIALDLDGQPSIVNGRFKLEFIDYEDKFKKAWAGLSLPSSRY